MNEDDNIAFDEMQGLNLDWGAGSNKISKQPEPDEKEYDSLYDELLDKCNPGKFPIGEFGNDIFQIANAIYTELQNKTDHTLIDLRNRAIDELGVHISTKKKYEQLEAFLNPEHYTARKPYNGEIVAMAGNLYDKLLKNKDDIRALESLEKEESTIEFKEMADEYDYQTLDPKQYMDKHPNGIHKKQVSIILEEAFFKNNSAHQYLQRYPNGKHAEEAHFSIDKSGREYLKKYPEGRYAKEAREDEVDIDSILAIGVIVLVIILIAVFSNLK